VEEKVWQPGLFNIRSFYGYYSGHRVGLLSSRRKRVKNIIFDQLSIIARLQSGEIKSWLDKGRADAEETARSEFFAAAISHFLRQPSPQNTQEVRERLELTTQVYGYSRIMILDRGKSRLFLLARRHRPELRTHSLPS